MTRILQGSHPDEGALVRVLDGQAGDSEQTTVQEHLEVCDECSLAFDELRHVSRTFQKELAQDVIVLPPSARTTFRSRAWFTWRVAAGITLLFAATSMFQPLRAWMVSGWQSVVGLFASDDAVEAVEPAMPVAPSVGGAIVSFAPRGERVLVDVATWQSDGELTIMVSDEESVSAQVLTSDAPEHLAIVPSGGISIANSATSVSDYRITTPHSLVRVTVRVAGSTVAEFAPVLGAEPTVVSLKAP